MFSNSLVEHKTTRVDIGNLLEPTIQITGQDAQGLIVTEASVSCHNTSGEVNGHLRTAVAEMLQVRARDASDTCTAVKAWRKADFWTFAQVILALCGESFATQT